MFKKVQIDFRVDKEVKEDLSALAEKLKLKRSDLLRAGINLVFEAHKELMKEIEDERSNKDT